MSGCLGDIVQSAMAKGAGTRDNIVASAQRHYYRYCSLCDWQELRVRTTITFTGSETNGALLPADMVGIMAVQCETDDSQEFYHPSQESMRYMRDGRARWFFKENVPEQTVAQDANIDVLPGALNWTGDAIAGAVDGDYIQFSDKPGFYKITSASGKTFTPAYRGPKLSGKSVTLRPPGTRRIQIVDDDGDLASGVVAVYYWAYPEPLYEDWQRILLPSVRPLELEVLVELLGTNKNRQREVDGYRVELGTDEAGARATMLSQNPRFIPPALHIGRTGRNVYFGRQSLPRVAGRW